jgi:DNA repair protein SbcC/Rad50
VRPVSLTVEGLRSFRSSVTIDFTGREHVAIIGDTGAGKSSLLEAMTWVLYGRTSWSAQPNQELMNGNSTELRVVLRFSIGSELWEIARVLSRKRDGTVGGAEVSLTRYDEGTEPIEQVEGVRQVEARIQELLGLTAEAFTRTVVLPQGEFARLLVSDRNTERAAILRQVWRLDELEAMREAARSAQELLRPMKARIEQALEREPPNPSEHLVEIEKRAAQASAKEKETREVRDAVNRACEIIVRAGEADRSVMEALAALEFDRDAFCRRANAIGEHARRLDTDRISLTEQKRDLQEELNRVPDDSDGMSLAELTRVRGILDRIEEQAHQAANAANATREAETQASNAEEAAAAYESNARLLRERVLTEQQQRAPIAERAEIAETQLRSALTLLAEARRHHSDMTSAQNDAAKQLHRMQKLAEALRLARDKLDTADRDFRDVTAALESARRADAAAHAAEGLAPGDACPVCARGLPVVWKAPTAPGLSELNDRVPVAERARRNAVDDVARIEADLTQIRERAKELGDEAEIASAKASKATDLLTSLLRKEAIDLAQADQVLLGDANESMQSTRRILQAFDRDFQAIEKSATEVNQISAVALQKAKGARERAVADVRSLTNMVRQLTRLMESLPEEIGAIDLKLPDHSEQVSTVDLPGSLAAREFLIVREKILLERDQQRRTLIAKAKTADVRLNEVTRSWETDVAAPARRLISDLDAHRSQLVLAVDRLRINDIDPPVVVNTEPANLSALVEQIHECTAVIRGVAEKKRSEIEASVKDARRSLTALAAELELGEGLNQGEILQIARARYDEAVFAARTAATDASRFRAWVGPLKRLISVLEGVTKKEVAIADLVAALNDGAFPRWITLKRSKALLVHASKLLADMTCNRYAFADLDDDNSEWLVVDQDTGLPRSPASLSGGEKFVASLSLALGMVEMMARSGGRLESLWLDEGFGALDRSNLDAAIQALATVASAGRLVAVVSHVRAVAEQVDDVLAVTRTANGSAARWLTASERTQLAENDEEALSVLSGLID